MKTNNFISGIRCEVVVSKQRYFLQVSGDPSFRLEDSDYVFINTDLSGTIYGLLGDFITIANNEIINFKEKSLCDFDPEKGITIFKAKDYEIAHEYHEIRSLLYDTIIDLRKRNVRRLLNRIQKSPFAENNEIFLYLQCSLYNRLGIYDRFIEKFNAYQTSGFKVFNENLFLYLQMLNATGFPSDKISALHQKRLGDAFDYVRKEIKKNKLYVENSVNDFVNTFKGKKGNAVIIAGHGKLENNSEDIIKIKKFIPIKSIFKEFKNNNVKCDVIVIISCWTNHLKFRTDKYGIKKVIFHPKKIHSIILKNFTKVTIEAFSKTTDPDEIFKYIKSELLKYSTIAGNVDQTPN